MDPVAARRANVAWTINQNPTAITIKRTEKIKSGGGFIENIRTLDPVTVRIFTQASRIPQKTISSLSGTKQIDKSWGLLADHLADIQAGPNVKDEFDDPEGHFLIKAVYPQYVQGQLVAYQCDLEKVT